LIVGLVILAVIAAAAFAAPLLAPSDPYAQDLTQRTAPPVWEPRGTWAHPLGTDALGRDYLSRLLYGGRVSLLVGLSVALLSGAIGLTLGLVAGYYGGRVDMVVSVLITTRLALPLILLALAAVALVGNSLLVVILVLGLLKWDRFAVVMRSATLQVAVLPRSRRAAAAAVVGPHDRRGEALHAVRFLADRAAWWRTGAFGACDQPDRRRPP
jgi:peptide/nickel transport system permease protein